MGWNLLFQGLMYSVTLIYGGYLIAKGFMNVGDLAMYALYIGIFISPIQILVELIEMIQKGLAGFRRFLDVMETEPEIKDASDAEELTDVKGLVRYENVSFHYADDDTSVLSHISFEIPAGRSVALVGPSGSGKTTICSLLPRFYDVTGGRITIDGKDVRTLTLKSLRSHIGVVQQDVYLFSGTIRDNIAYGRPDASEEDVIDAAKAAHAHSFIRRLPDGYDTVITENGGNISQGQKQLLCIARVMLGGENGELPPMLILDEATSSIDTRTEIKIQSAFARLMNGRTSFIVAHRLSTIQEADVILVMKDGHIIEQGTHEELLKKQGFYANLYQSQFALG